MKTHTRLMACLLATMALLTAPGAKAKEKDAGVLLITHEDLAEAWTPFADWKTKNGKPTRLITVSEIAGKYKGRDIQEKIRACCLESIETHGTKWVILGGDSDPDSSKMVPDRDTPHQQVARKYKALPTDVYYISPKDWDTNKDGVYGDWLADREDVSYTNPGACISRIPLRTVADVKAYTAKVIAFESAKIRPGAANMVYTCPEPGAYPKLVTSRNIVAASWPDGKVQEFLASSSPWDSSIPGDHDLDVGNWLELINSGKVEKMHMHGHGLIQNWILEGNRKVTLKDVANLKNADSPLILTTVSCFTGEFDSKTDPSIAEAMLRHSEGGALVMIAPSREGRPIFHDPRRDMPTMIRNGKMDGTTETMTLFWKYALEGTRTVGEAFAMTKAHFSPDAAKTPGYHFLLCELNLLGDPTLSLGKH